MHVTLHGSARKTLLMLIISMRQPQEVTTWNVTPLRFQKIRTKPEMLQI